MISPTRSAIQPPTPIQRQSVLLTSQTSGDSGEPSDLPEPEGHDHHLTPEYEGTDEEQEAAAREDEHDIRSSVDDGIEQLEADGRDLSDSRVYPRGFAPPPPQQCIRHRLACRAC